MSKQVSWNKVILEEFIEIGGLTKIEEQIMRTRVAGWSRVEQSMKFGISIATVDRIIASCKRKYDNCQPYSPLLPPRQKCAKESYRYSKAIGDRQSMLHSLDEYMDEMTEKLQNMMHDADTQEERDMIQKYINKVRM